MGASASSSAPCAVDETRTDLPLSLLPYANERPFVDSESQSLFVDGEIVMMIAARELVERKPEILDAAQTRLLGGAAHASILTGMPQSEAVFVLGPLHVLFTFGAVLVSPVLAIAAALEAWYARSHDENALPNAVRRRASVSGRL